MTIYDFNFVELKVADKMQKGAKRLKEVKAKSQKWLYAY
jgi:hypothetical protein